MRVGIIGTGLIGGSIATGLAELHEIIVFDPDRERCAALQQRVPNVQIVDSREALGAQAEIVIIATPVAAIAEAVQTVLAASSAVVTDVGSVKSTILEEIGNLPEEQRKRFVGGHPMAGSEQDGLAGADPLLFQEAVWITTPTIETTPEAMRMVKQLIHDLGAQQIVLDAQAHDELVAVVSHVPQLVASSLMGYAADQPQQAALARLAAGGFRDMTRIAASHPAIWPDICAANREAILSALDGLTERLDEVRALVDQQDRSGLLQVLEHSRNARRSLPSSASRIGPLSELRVPILDRPGVLAEITAAASDLGVNIFDIETTHSAEGDSGVLILAIREGDVEPLRSGLVELGYRPTAQPIVTEE